MKKVIFNLFLLFTIIGFGQDGIHKNEEGIFYVQFVEEIESELNSNELKKIVSEKIKKDLPNLTYTEEGKDFFQYQGAFRVTWKIPLVGTETQGITLRARTEFKDGRYRVTWDNFRFGTGQEPLKKFYDSAKKRKKKAIDEKISEMIIETKDYIKKAIAEGTKPKADKDKW